MPPTALANDMMIFYAPKEIYIQNATVVELVCASVCITSMICCTLEMKHRRENPFDSQAHMARHRMGARGNATSFPLPWSDLLTELLRLDGESQANESPDSPSMLIVASSNAQAKNISTPDWKGRTLHNAACMRVQKIINSRMRPGDKATALERVWRNVRVLVIEEVSMVSAANYNMQA